MAASNQLSRITAVMLGVRDLEKSLEFYKEKLGLKVMMQEPGLALLECGGVVLGLSRGPVNLAPHVAGATDLVFGVNDVRAAYKALTEKGVVFMREPRQATPTDWVANFKDPDGHILSVFGAEGEKSP